MRIMVSHYETTVDYWVEDADGNEMGGFSLEETRPPNQLSKKWAVEDRERLKSEILLLATRWGCQTIVDGQEMEVEQYLAHVIG